MPLGFALCMTKLTVYGLKGIVQTPLIVNNLNHND